MAAPEIKYLKALYGSNVNLAFVGVMVFLSLVVNPAMLFFLVAGEMGLFMLGQIGFVQKLIQTSFDKQAKLAQQEKEEQVATALPSSYQSDFLSLKGLCQEIERRANDQQNDKTAVVAMGGLIEKLDNFRFEYLQMLRAHSLLANRNYKQLKNMLEKELKNAEQNLCKESSEQVKFAIEQNLKILRQRLTKVKQLEDLVRLIEARLQVVRNSLQLVQDELYSMTNVRGIAAMVDGLLVNMEISDEFRTSYNELLAEENAAFSGLDTAALNQENLNVNLNETNKGRNPSSNKIKY